MPRSKFEQEKSVCPQCVVENHDRHSTIFFDHDDTSNKFRDVAHRCMCTCDADNRPDGLAFLLDDPEMYDE